jgi:hypothetical protein
MTQVLSVDIGIKNLAICIITDEKQTKKVGDFRIDYWDVINTLEEESSQFIPCPVSNRTGRKIGECCGKMCKFKWTDKEGNVVYSCKTHFPKELRPIKTQNRITTKLVKDIHLQDIAYACVNKVKELWEGDFSKFNFTKIIIELQPRVNNKMKFVSHILYGKFVELTDNKIPIRFIKGSSKLKVYTGPPIECKLRNAYDKRKRLAIQHATWFLETQFSEAERERWYPFFKNSRKMDDLADCLLYTLFDLCGNFFDIKQRRKAEKKELKKAASKGGYLEGENVVLHGD